MKPSLTWTKKNWKSITIFVLIAVLILVNVKQYQSSQKIIADNQRINEQYQNMLLKEITYNQQIASYQAQIAQKDSSIKASKQEIAKTEIKLSISQGQVRDLSRRILKGNKVDQDSLLAYIETCDSLATVAPVLADQVDTLKVQNQELVTTMEQKSALQDSIITKKDTIITEKQLVLDKTLKSYNNTVSEYVTLEKRFNKEKKKKSFWIKASIILAGAAGAVIATK